MALAADLHWVKGGCVLDGAVRVERLGVTLRDVRGSGPIDDLRERLTQNGTLIRIREQLLRDKTANVLLERL